MPARSAPHISMIVRASSTPEQVANLENQLRTFCGRRQSLAARSSSCAQLGSNSPAKRIAFKFSWDFVLIWADYSRLSHLVEKRCQPESGQATRCLPVGAAWDDRFGQKHPQNKGCHKPFLCYFENPFSAVEFAFTAGKGQRPEICLRVKAGGHNNIKHNPVFRGMP